MDKKTFRPQRKYLYLFPHNIQTTRKDKDYSDSWSPEDPKPSVFPKKGKGYFVKTRCFIPDLHTPGPGTVRVQCSGTLHEISLDENWNIVIHAHEDVRDIEAGLALGYQGTHRCLIVKRKWDKILSLLRNYEFRKDSGKRKSWESYLKGIPAAFQRAFSFGLYRHDEYKGTIQKLRIDWKKTYQRCYTPPLAGRVALHKNTIWRKAVLRCGFTGKYLWSDSNARPKRWFRDVRQRGLDRAIDGDFNPVFISMASPWDENPVSVVIRKPTGLSDKNGAPVTENVWGIAKRGMTQWIVEEGKNND
jgi:hypothetical protein